ncbi:MAG: fumarylacetoacetate hydrolase family protein [Alphaproteobacteria bacterium]|nr:fumarylacetoacetate hydrolase family protein [Alphaproteobacteria bacterium]
MEDTEIDQAAALLARARLDAAALEHLPSEATPPDLNDAYAIQSRLHAILSEAGHGPFSGHKIGCTTKVMQDYMKIPSPCAGMIPAPLIFEGETRLPRSRFCNPGVECEIAVRLKADMPARPGGYDRASAAACIGAAMASIELVDQRWTDFRALPTPPLVADDFFNAGCVHGPETAVDPFALDRVRGRMRINGADLGEGVGADILGHPLDALAWLADLRAAQGAPLRADALVTLGSILQTEWIDAGDHIEIEMDGLGAAELTLS